MEQKRSMCSLHVNSYDFMRLEHDSMPARSPARLYTSFSSSLLSVGWLLLAT